MGLLRRLFGRKNDRAIRRAVIAHPPRFDLAELARRLAIDANALRAIEPRYHEFQIPKRSGGTRRILAPTPELKQLQRTILRRLLSRLRAHPAAIGFERKHSIATNALHHMGRAVVIRMDIVRFFESTRADRIEHYFRAIGWDQASARLLAKLTTRDGALPAGAPTSPRLSNLVNYQLDARLAAFAASTRGAYTRYADDLTFSYDHDGYWAGDSIFRFARMVLVEYGYRLHRRKKRSVRRRHQQQRVTGLVVNGGVNLPRTTRRRLRAIEHHLRHGRRATLTEDQLRGWRALEQMVRTVAGR